MIVTVDQVEHEFVSRDLPGRSRGEGARYLPTCSCGWRGVAVHGIGNDVPQWNEHVRVGER